MNHRGEIYDSVEACVDDTLSRVGKTVVLATPLGLGKANNIVNEFYRRAHRDGSLAATDRGGRLSCEYTTGADEFGVGRLHGQNYQYSRK